MHCGAADEIKMLCVQQGFPNKPLGNILNCSCKWLCLSKSVHRPNTMTSVSFDYAQPVCEMIKLYICVRLFRVRRLLIPKRVNKPCE